MSGLPQGTVSVGRTWRNWGRSVQASPRFVVRAGSVEEVQTAVRFARERGLPIKPIGAGHSFSAVAATNGVQLDLRWLDGLLAVDGPLVTLGAGTNLFQLPALLGPLGLAPENLGDIDRQTVAGAVSTGTHGTGLRFGGLASRIRGARLVTADGELLTVSTTEHADLLPAVALGIGALGILVDVTIECVPAFALRAIERRERLDAVLDEWPERIAADHFEFYSWPHTASTLTKTNERLPAGAPTRPLGRWRGWFDDTLMANAVYSGLLAVGSAIPPVVPGVSRAAAALVSTRDFSDDAHAVFTSPRAFRFREMEYAIPVEAVPDALRDIHALIRHRGWRISMPIEVRTAAADDRWLSTAYGRVSGYLALHRVATERMGEYFAEAEPILSAYGGRPHWGKIHRRRADTLREAYPRFDDFLALRDRLDPDRVFANEYLRRVLGA